MKNVIFFDVCIILYIFIVYQINFKTIRNFVWRDLWNYFVNTPFAVAVYFVRRRSNKTAEQPIILFNCFVMLTGMLKRNTKLRCLILCHTF